ncbi:Hydroxyproline-rich glycoprotein [Heracleum sosnowskyi]|uniref:Hydroxyproline-rich glycoprotein n=1 Tax=Heracleum sosnowskyi TaxID=360622 RepID=A0AAD8IJQ4_9APIA|nr:Hydroxyproline-rich glycoprotein [Heracleum sosnowskyi]
MTSTYKNIVTTFIFLSIILNSPTTITSQECPYPCYPSPPIGGGTSPPSNPTPPGSNFPPPGPFGNPPPTGFLPNGPPPPYYLNNNAPPPPNQMVPWFPYYFRKPPHESDQSSSSSPSAHVSGWTAVIIPISHLLVFSYVFLF